MNFLNYLLLLCRTVCEQQAHSHKVTKSQVRGQATACMVP